MGVVMTTFHGFANGDLRRQLFEVKSYYCTTSLGRIQYDDTRKHIAGLLCCNNEIVSLHQALQGDFCEEEEEQHSFVGRGIVTAFALNHSRSSDVELLSCCGSRHWNFW